MDMQRVKVKREARIVHVETELGIVNIFLGLRDRLGRKVEAVEMRADNLAGESLVRRVGRRFVQLKTVKGGKL